MVSDINWCVWDFFSIFDKIWGRFVWLMKDVGEMDIVDWVFVLVMDMCWVMWWVVVYEDFYWWEMVVIWLWCVWWLYGGEGVCNCLWRIVDVDGMVCYLGVRLVVCKLLSFMLCMVVYVGFLVLMGYCIVWLEWDW